ncbi:MAG: MoxR family ATPase [Candidatus Omnitrophica bacterium]|nr:MoxR family ATPase [Candidatus Omnitrophota bacterium]
MTPHKKLEDLAHNIEQVIVGKRHIIDLLLTALLAKGHVLIQDIPGVGKTTLANALAKSISAEFRRVQFTPDLLPTDITGVSIYNQATQQFEFKKGPVFTNILLADEINRTTPRTQSSLLECMQEFHVSVDGITYPLPDLFMVIATQNPIEFHGTYPLPEAQIDRFLLQVNIGYPSQEQEKQILKNRIGNDPLEDVRPVMSSNDVLELRTKVQSVYIDEAIISYITEVIRHTRELTLDVKLGASPRSTIALMNAARAYAFLRGKEYVIPSDVKALAFPVLGHRLVLQPRSVAKGLTPEKVIEYALSKTTVPTKE